MNTALKIKNKYLLGLCTWLQELSLAGRESRERSRFIEVCVSRINEIEKNRKEMIGKFVEKNEDGSWKKKETDGKEIWDISEEKSVEFQKEYEDLMEEEFVIDVLEGNKAKVKTVKDLVLNTEYKFGPREGDDEVTRAQRIRQAAEYEDWCKAFEEVEV